MQNGSLDETLESIIKEARRCGAIVKNVLKFAKEEETPKALHQLDEVVNRAAALAKSYVQRSDLTIELSFKTPPWRRKARFVCSSERS
jgi:hypothetical protein